MLIIRPFGAVEFSNKVEIKNLNSISNIKRLLSLKLNAKLN